MVVWKKFLQLIVLMETERSIDTFLKSLNHKKIAFLICSLMCKLLTINAHLIASGFYYKVWLVEEMVCYRYIIEILLMKSQNTMNHAHSGCFTSIKFDGKNEPSMLLAYTRKDTDDQLVKLNISEIKPIPTGKYCVFVFRILSAPFLVKSF